MRGLAGSGVPLNVLPAELLAGSPLGALTSFIPRSLVERVVWETRTRFRRNRLLPAPLVVYFVLALTLFRDDPYMEVLRKLLESLKLPGMDMCPRLPHESSLSKARLGLGAAPLKVLFQRVARPIAHEFTRGAFFRNLRLVAIDGSCCNVYDSPENAGRFNYPPASRGEVAFPQIRVLTLIECGTHAPIGLALGGCDTSEQALAPQIFPLLTSDMLCLADRNFFSFHSWGEATRQGCQLLWRVKKNLRLPAETILDDGSYLSTIYPDERARRAGNGITVRVIEYQILGVPDAEPSYRLVTTLLDPNTAPAQELAELYQERWEVETTLDEIKNHLKANWLLFRSKTPELVEQEVYALFLTHFSLRCLMHEAASRADRDPDTISFTHTLRVVRRTLPRVASFSP